MLWLLSWLWADDESAPKKIGPRYYYTILYPVSLSVDLYVWVGRDKQEKLDAAEAAEQRLRGIETKLQTLLGERIG